MTRKNYQILLLDEDEDIPDVALAIRILVRSDPFIRYGVRAIICGELDKGVEILFETGLADDQVTYIVSYLLRIPWSEVYRVVVDLL